MTNTAYITNTDSNSLSVVDIDSAHEFGRIEIGDTPRGAMAIDTDKNLGFVSNCAGDTISVIDLIKNKETKRVHVGLAPRGVEISPNLEYVFVSNSGSATVSFVSTAKLETVFELEVGRNPRQLSISSDGSFIAVPNFGSDSVSIIDINYDDITKSSVRTEIFLPKDAKPYHAFIDNFDPLIFTANTFNHSVSVIDIEKNSVTNNIPVGYGPRAVISDTTGKYLFTSEEASNAVGVIDRETFTEIKRITVGGTPRGMKIDTKNNTLLVTCFERMMALNIPGQTTPLFNESVSVIDLNSLTHIGSLPSGLGACSLNILETAFTQHDFVGSLDINTNLVEN